MPNPRFLTIRDFSERYRVCRATVYNLLAAGQLSAVKARGRTLIGWDVAESWANNLPASRHVSTRSL
jgi:hypothetical protein